MPRYFFDIHDGERATRDDSGIELPSVDHLWEIAVSMVDDIARAKYGGARLYPTGTASPAWPAPCAWRTGETPRPR